MRGLGTQESPYLIDNLADLNNVRNNVAAGTYYKLAADIDASSTSTWNDGAGWEPIANFAANFDGDYHIIKGLFINRNTNFNGLFGDLAAGATITKLAVSEANITGASYNGALFGRFDGDGSVSISLCCSSGNVVGTGDNNGGLGGRVNGSGIIVDQCFSVANVSGPAVAANTAVGGLFGSAGGGATVTNCYAKGTTYGDPSIGAFIGSASTVTIRFSYAMGAVTGNTGTYSRGFCGYGISLTTESNYWDKETTGKSSGFGASGKTTAQMQTQSTYVGWDFTNTWQWNTNNYPTLKNLPESLLNKVPNEVVSSTIAISMDAKSPSSSVWALASSPSITIESQLGTPSLLNGHVLSVSTINIGITTVEPIFRSQVNLTSDRIDLFVLVNDVSPGIGVLQTSPKIGIDLSIPQTVRQVTGQGTVEDPWAIRTVDEFLAIANNTTAAYRLDNDLDFGGLSRGPVSGFYGYLDGNRKTISNLTISAPETNRVGLFSTVSNATIKNLNLNLIKVEGKQNVGALAGLIQNSVDLQYINVNCQIVEAHGGFAGGIVGLSAFTDINKTIYRCSFTGIVSSGYIYWDGGFGSPRYVNYAGGIIGSTDTPLTITECIVKDSFVYGYQQVGGIIGRVNETNVTIVDSYTINTWVQGCYGSGQTANNQYVGGFVGYAAQNFTTTRCGNFLSRVTREDGGTTYPWYGGGSGEPVSKYCYWTAAATYYPTGTGYSTRLAASQALQQVNFSKWNFTNTWVMGDTNPILRWNLTIPVLVSPPVINIGMAAYPPIIGISISITVPYSVAITTSVLSAVLYGSVEIRAPTADIVVELLLPSISRDVVITTQCININLEVLLPTVIIPQAILVEAPSVRVNVDTLTPTIGISCRQVSPPINISAEVLIPSIYKGINIVAPTTNVSIRVNKPIVAAIGRIGNVSILVIENPSSMSVVERTTSLSITERQTALTTTERIHDITVTERPSKLEVLE
jgi:hypothetical protein